MKPRSPRLIDLFHRVCDVVSVLTKYGLADWLSHTEFVHSKRLLRGREGELLAQQTRAVRIRLAAVELGTTYIKLGQMLSTRADLVGLDVANELAKLQEGVPPDAPEVTLATVATELGRPVSECFTDFDPTTIGSASIGQVHRACLPDGRKVVVKVQHPGIESRIRSDLEIMEELARLAEKSSELRRFQPVNVIQEFRRSLFRELDFSREERNLQQFADNFADDPMVHFPQVFSRLCTSRILTMEFLDGVGLHESDRLEQLGIEREELARRGATIWMDMVFRDGFFHADPHPGNILVLPGGVIGILDCGMVGRLSEPLRETMEDVLAAVATHDGARLARLIMNVCSAPSKFDEETFTSDISDYLVYYGSQPIDRFQLSGALNEIVQIISRYRLVLPGNVSNVIKVFAMLEGTAQLLSPKVNVLELIKAYKGATALRRLSSPARWTKWRGALAEWLRIAENLPKDLSDVLRKIEAGEFDIHLEHRRLEPSVNRLVMGMVTSALFLGSAVLWSNKVPPVIGGYPALGVAGCALSFVLGARLLRRIWNE